jgi:peptidyl-tRNA hydrolase, PTH1 family
MALFQKKPIIESVMPLYTLSANKNLLIIGLGNPGPEYEKNRHNIGFAGVERYAEDNEFDPWITKKDLKCLLTQKTVSDTRVLLAKPTTFMNNSGEAMQAICSFFKISPEHVIVVHDELDIAYGQIRCRTGGGAAGHNGIKSIIRHGGESTGRVRIGIGPKTHEQMDSADFVLQNFTNEEMKRYKEITREVSAILTETVYGDGQLPQDTRSIDV